MKIFRPEYYWNHKNDQLQNCWKFFSIELKKNNCSKSYFFEEVTVKTNKVFFWFEIWVRKKHSELNWVFGIANYRIWKTDLKENCSHWKNIWFEKKIIHFQADMKKIWCNQIGEERVEIRRKKQGKKREKNKRKEGKG